MEIFNKEDYQIVLTHNEEPQIQEYLENLGYLKLTAPGHVDLEIMKFMVDISKRIDRLEKFRPDKNFF